MHRRKIKVLHLANIVNKNDFVDSLVSNLNPDLFEISVATFTNNATIQATDYADRGILHHTLNITSRKQYGSALFKLLDIIKKNKIDILHTHMFDEAILGACIKLLYPKIVFILGRHYSDEIYQTAKGWRLKRSLLAENFANKKADAITAVSTFIEKLLLKQGVAKQKIFRTTYGFDFKMPKYNMASAEAIDGLRKELGIRDEFVFLNAGRHYFLKRQDLLIEAFGQLTKQHPNVKLLLVGDGPWNAFLRNQVHEKKLGDKVHFLGWRTDVPLLLNVANVVVQPTMTEAFPQIMIETMANARLLIISKVSGTEDVIIDRQTGYLIEKGNLQSLANALKYAVENAGGHKQIGAAARQYVLQNLGIEKVILDYEKLYKSFSF